jgi:hypothetical protein
MLYTYIEVKREKRGESEKETSRKVLDKRKHGSGSGKLWSLAIWHTARKTKASGSLSKSDARNQNSTPAMTFKGT